MALLDADSLTEAARHRNVSQPAFSRRLRAAEALVGAELLDRAVKPARLRPGVHALAPRLREAAAEIRQLRIDLRLAAVEEAGGLVIATQHSVATTRAAVIVERLEGVPVVRGVRLRSANRDDCTRMLMAGRADIALVHRLPGGTIWHRPSEIEVVRLATDRLIPVAAPAEAERAARGRLRLVAYPGDVFLGRVFATRIAPHLPEALTLERRAETALASAVHALAREGFGVAWLTESLARADVASGRLHDLSDELPSTELELCGVRTVRHRGAAAEAAWRRLFDLDGTS